MQGNVDIGQRSSRGPVGQHSGSYWQLDWSLKMSTVASRQSPEEETLGVEMDHHGNRHAIDNVYF